MIDKTENNWYYWKKGKGNKADYFSKYFCAAHHREQRSTFLTPRKVLDALRATMGKAQHIYVANERVC